MDKKEEDIKWSEYVLHLAKWYLVAAAAFLVLYFLLYTIEHHKTTIVITRSYRVPIEKDEEVNHGDSGPDD